MSIFSKIDQYFYKKSKKDFIYIVILLIMIIGFVYFYYVFPLAKKYESNALSNYQTKLNDLSRNKIQLNALKIQHVQLKNKVRDLQSKFFSLKKQAVYYTQFITLLDFAKFNKYKWAEFVKNILNNAKNEGLIIELLENKIVNEDSDKLKKMPKYIIVKKLSVGLSLNGNYKNFIHFLYKYESLQDLIRVREMNITSETEQYVKFDLYGYEK